MMAFPLTQLAPAAGGRLNASGVDPLIRAVCTDTRSMTPDSLFVAIKGERFDAHNMVDKAAAGGAVAAVVDRDRATEVKAQNPGLPLIEVASTRTALGAIARHVRDHLGGRVVAVAGSNGKTSTKHLIDSALCRDLKGSMSPKSFNNDIGVPLTIFDADPQDDYLVLEMGTNHPGEIRTLTHIGRPDVAVLTNCSEEHLEFLGDVAGVRRENTSILEGLAPDGLLVVNGDDASLLGEIAPYAGRRVTFGFRNTNTLFATDVRPSERGVMFKVSGSRGEWFVPLLGRHTASNALAAIAVARELGLADGQIKAALAVAHGPEMRLQLRTVGGVRVLNDAYNANPASMKAALETLGTLPSEGRRIAVLGDMKELGDTSETHHREIGKFAAGSNVDVLACVGRYAPLLAASALDGGMADTEIHCFPDSAAASKVVPAWLREGDVILLKGSRGVQLELVAREIETRRLAS